MMTMRKIDVAAIGRRSAGVRRWRSDNRLQPTALLPPGRPRLNRHRWAADGLEQAHAGHTEEECLKSPVNRRTVDLAAYPDLVVIYLACACGR